MKIFVLQFLILGLATATFAGDLQSFSITTNEEINVRQKLEAFEKGTLDPKGLTENGRDEDCRKIISYYLLHTNDVSVKAKFPISRCFISFGRYQDAAKLAQDYVNVYSNDFNGWEALAYCCVAMTNHMLAIKAYKMAVKLGDNDAYQALAGEAIRGHQLDIVQNILPQLMTLQQAAETSHEDKNHLTTILLAYSMMTDQKNIFVKALAGQDRSNLLQNETIKKNVTSGCMFFEGADIDKIRREMESASSSTNSISRPPR